jgi:hypothetical protein
VVSALLLDVMYRSLVRQEASWDLVAIAGFAVAWSLHRPPARPTGPVPEGSAG